MDHGWTNSRELHLSALAVQGLVSGLNLLKPCLRTNCFSQLFSRYCFIFGFKFFFFNRRLRRILKTSIKKYSSMLVYVGVESRVR